MEQTAHCGHPQEIYLCVRLFQGTLAHLEEEVSGFFKLWPSSIFVSQLPSSYERLLMHALCQYLDLCSKSESSSPSSLNFVPCLTRVVSSFTFSDFCPERLLRYLCCLQVLTTTTAFAKRRLRTNTWSFYPRRKAWLNSWRSTDEESALGGHLGWTTL